MASVGNKNIAAMRGRAGRYCSGSGFVRERNSQKTEFPENKKKDSQTCCLRVFFLYPERGSNPHGIATGGF